MTAIESRQFLKADLWREWASLETDQRKGLPPPAVEKPIPPDAQLVDLVPPANFTIGQMPLIEALRRRRSRRSFTGEPLTMEALSFLLWATQGVRRDEAGVPVQRGAAVLRTTPSGGARHPFETYLVIRNIEELAPGLYRYLPLTHKLCFLQPYSALAGRVDRLWARQGFLEQAAVIFIWTTIPYRTEWRYTVVAAKIIAQDTGHLCQNLYLACEAIGAGMCAIGAYDQQDADAVVGVDGEEEFTVYMAPVGKYPPSLVEC
jgi:SagB-type dehydrogenase family enzyme